MTADLSVQSLEFIEEMLAQWRADPESVSPEWRALFSTEDRTQSFAAPRFDHGSIFNPPTAGARNGDPGDVLARLVRQDRVDQHSRAYRVRGHLIARLDPLGNPRAPHPELELAHYGLGEADLDHVFSSRTISGTKTLTLRQILDLLRNTYCGSIGVQFMHIDDLEIKEWLQWRMEGTENKRHLTRREQLRILTKLTDAEIFEQFLQKKFLGSKRFSLEGAETLIPLMDLMLEEAGLAGVEEVVLGMPHRGRLNVLANIMGKSARQIFREFEDIDPELHVGGGDVKYHMGHSTDIETNQGHRLHVSLCFNPSHLEFVGPVVQGRVRAKQDRKRDRARSRVLPFIVHGDAAMAGEGVVQELFNMSELDGYTTGGTVHIVVNNQIGFTTPPESARSTYYATDVAKMLQSPIFHVNGEEPEAVAQVIDLAMDFRARFHKDVVIDMYCYRRRGHNEGDDPAFTQPMVYRALKTHRGVRERYVDHILDLHELTRAEADEIAVWRRRHLEAELEEARSPEYSYVKADSMQGIWMPYRGGADRETPEQDTALPREQVAWLLERLTVLPDQFTPHPKIARFLDQRLEMARGERPIDWGAAEALAFASLLTADARVRLSGQDSGRGTFSHRHAVLHDYETGQKYVPLAHVAPDQAPFEVIDSPLSETGVLGFDWGYSLDCPDGLVLWEAQFGDFVNVAQPILDQFIASSEDKWARLSALVMLLPHGFEGQGPEHSSARLERFLGQAAEDNMQIVNLTTPAQLFHCLRRQVLRPYRKPLVVMAPKSLLRHPRCASTLAEMARGPFQRIIGDPLPPGEVRRLLLCTGKIYYELLEAREERERRDVAIVRLEQLYPLAEEDIAAALAPYADGTPAMWVQEEPENKGAWHYLRLRFGDTLVERFPLTGICRPPSASPATGSAATHKRTQALIIDRALS